MTRTVLVVGGAGAFGGRLVAGLIGTTDFDVIVAGRDLRRAERRVAEVGSARARALRLDTATASAEELRATGAFVVIDAAGPFQGADYRLARAAIDAGLHYVDLADARDFVAGFPLLDPAARAAGVVALTGASSIPALSHAVLDHLTAGWHRIETIEIAISPGNRNSPRGLSVIQAILSYAGKPVRVFVGGAWIRQPGWGWPIRRDMPGLGKRWLSLCETPDLDLVPARFAPCQAAIFRAGLELSSMHWGLSLGGLLVRARLLPSLLPFARLFRWLAERLKGFGSDRGSMVVEVAGIDAAGIPARAAWSLVAEAGDGPAVPTLPALAVARALADGSLSQAGAGPCVGMLTLDAMEREFAPYRITTRIMTSATMRPSPFQQLLGDAFARLPEPLRGLHALSTDVVAEGRSDIAAAKGFLPWLICRLSGLPAAGRDVPVTVAFHVDGQGGEFWRRRFAGRRYASGFSVGTDGHAGLLCERFFPFVFFHSLTASPEGLRWDLMAWRLLWLPLPRWMMPPTVCFESADGNRFVFDINVRFPIIGQLIHYRGWLERK